MEILVRKNRRETKKLLINAIEEWETDEESVEKSIGFSKDGLNLIPLRVHKEETLRGYLLLIFITVTVFALLRRDEP